MLIHCLPVGLLVGLVNAGGGGLLAVGDGKLGVNFLGFQAGVNIGHDGKLEAEAGTPWGAKAGAGVTLDCHLLWDDTSVMYQERYGYCRTISNIGKNSWRSHRAGAYLARAPGTLIEKGPTRPQVEPGIQGEAGQEGAGLLYAGAAAGGGISAAAGLEGKVSGEGSYGSSYAGASAGGNQVEIIKEKSIPSGSADISASYKSHIVAPTYTKNIQVIKKPVEIGVVAETHHEPVHPPEVKPVTTVIQKTIIPNYEKKIIKVPSYEEKVVRVPTIVEKEVWVPAAPTIIEKEVNVPQPAPPPPVVHTVETVPVIYKTKFRKRPHFHFRKHFSFGGDYDGGYAGGYTGAGGVDNFAQGSYRATVTKTAHPQLFTDIINIPVSTLGAVSKLLTGISSGVSASGSLGFSKSIGASKSFSASGGGSAYY